ncbi:MAG TPA: plastocyanin/azurin family copper-binding protein [Actinomycetota bacterium]|nr:plastocyanin/azurin family copper-binding protein [Actinomycetota bacterium]
MTRRIVTLIAALVGVSSMLSVTAPAARAEAKEAVVEMSTLAFKPANLSVETGTTVIWSNKELINYPAVGATHRIAADDNSFKSEDIALNASWTKLFLKPATIAYRCEIHPQLMKGTLTVTGPPITTPPPGATIEIVEPKATQPEGWTYRPKDLTVDVGTKVTWRNVGGTNHTVTATDGSIDEDLKPGQKYEHTFTKSVALRYACKPHPWMTGTLVVKKPGEKTPAPPPPIDTGNNANGNVDVVVRQPPRSASGPSTYNVQVVEADLTKPMEWKFTPAALGIRVGDTVVWKNTGTQMHTVTSSSFDSGNMDPGDIFSRTFTQAGTIPFTCKPHPWMKGTISVAAAGAPVTTPPSSTPTDVLGEEFERPDAPIARTPNIGDVFRSGADGDRTLLALRFAALLLLIGAGMLVTGKIELRSRPQVAMQTIAVPRAPAMEPLKLEPMRKERAPPQKRKT